MLKQQIINKQHLRKIHSHKRKLIITLAKTVMGLTTPRQTFNNIALAPRQLQWQGGIACCQEITLLREAHSTLAIFAKGFFLLIISHFIFLSEMLTKLSTGKPQTSLPLGPSLTWPFSASRAHCFKYSAPSSPFREKFRDYSVRKAHGTTSHSQNMTRNFCTGMTSHPSEYDT